MKGAEDAIIETMEFLMSIPIIGKVFAIGFIIIAIIIMACFPEHDYEEDYYY